MVIISVDKAQVDALKKMQNRVYKTIWSYTKNCFCIRTLFRIDEQMQDQDQDQSSSSLIIRQDIESTRTINNDEQDD